MRNLSLGLSSSAFVALALLLSFTRLMPEPIGLPVFILLSAFIIIGSLLGAIVGALPYLLPQLKPTQGSLLGISLGIGAFALFWTPLLI